MQPSILFHFQSEIPTLSPRSPPPPPPPPPPPIASSFLPTSPKVPSTTQGDTAPAKRPRTFWDTVLPSSSLSPNPHISKSAVHDNLTTNANCGTDTATPLPFVSERTGISQPLCTSPLSDYVRPSSPQSVPIPSSEPCTKKRKTSQRLEDNATNVSTLLAEEQQDRQISAKNGVKPHSCERCQATFARLSHLRLHVRTIHEKQKPFRCSECSATFGHISSKYRHYRTVHLKRRDFSCSKCGQTFAERSAVQKHCRTVHEGCRPYPCHICGFRFHFKLHLDQHVATVHDKLRPHACVVCHARFGQRSSLNRHHRQIHGGSVMPTLSNSQDK